MDYYDFLEISKDATQIEIKKAYKKLALKYHPDKNQSIDTTEKFQQISEAYQTLSHSSSKKNYDNDGSIPKNFMKPTDIFSHIFSNIDPVLGNFLTNTLTGITQSLLDDKNKNIYDVLNDFNSEEFIEKGGDVLKFYLKKNTKSSFNNNIPESYIYNLTLQEEDLHIIEENEINININFLRKYSHIKLIIKKDTNEKKYLLNLIHTYFTFEFNKNIYTFSINYNFPPGIHRKKYDLYLNYTIDIIDYNNGFYFTYPLGENVFLEANINILDTNIIQFQNEGIIHSKEGKMGNFYVIFKPTINTLLEEPIKNNCITIHSLSYKDL